MSMKFLVVGLGSMGKRRIRCLRALGYREIYGYDPRADRRAEACDLYGITSFEEPGAVPLDEIDALLISTPPDHHEPYLRLAVERRKPAFVEASVVLRGLREIDSAAQEHGVLLAPSCTLRFHAAIKDIKRLVQDGRYGRLTNFTYHTGQYLPDWHPWEKVTDFYVSRKEVGGCREIVPFELTWLVDAFGVPLDVHGFFGRTMDVGAPIDDTYAVSMKFPNGFGLMMVDVVARQAIRRLIVNLERAQILWDWDDNQVRLYEADSGRWVTYAQKQFESHPGYHKNIAEEMYVDELRAFIESVEGKRTFPNTLKDDISVLELLHRIEGTK